MTPELFEAAAFFTAYLWCTWFHRKHHEWGFLHTSRFCLKCGSVYYWPDAKPVKQSTEYLQWKELQEKSQQKYEEIAKSLAPGELIPVSASDLDFPDRSPILEKISVKVIDNTDAVVQKCFRSRWLELTSLRGSV